MAAEPAAVLVVDDEPLARQRLAHLLRELREYRVVGEAGSGTEALEQVQRLQPSIVLLDIRMPGMDGLEAARHLARLEKPPAVIFTTAYGDHALTAFEVRAVDYLLKPIARDRLLEALSRASALERGLLEELGRETEAARSHLPVRRGDRVELLPVDRIRCLLAEEKYVTALCPGTSHLLDESLKGLEEEFGDRFLRVHRKALVAREHLLRLEKDPEEGFLLHLRDIERPVPVSRRHLAEVRALFRSRR